MIITMSCGDALSDLPGNATKPGRPRPGQPIVVGRAIRNDIQARISTLLGQVLHYSQQ